jgi:hypothetical protein
VFGTEYSNYYSNMHYTLYTLYTIHYTIHYINQSGAPVVAIAAVIGLPVPYVQVGSLSIPVTITIPINTSPCPSKGIMKHPCGQAWRSIVVRWSTK